MLAKMWALARPTRTWGTVALATVLGAALLIGGCALEAKGATVGTQANTFTGKARQAQLVRTANQGQGNLIQAAAAEAVEAAQQVKSLERVADHATKGADEDAYQQKAKATPEPQGADRDDDEDQDSEAPEADNMVFRGFVTNMPAEGTIGTWEIRDYTVTTDEHTDFKFQLGEATTGAYVQVIGRLQPDGTVIADKILVKKYEPGNGPKAIKPEKPEKAPEADHPERDQKQQRDQERQQEQLGAQAIEFRGFVTTMPAGGTTGAWNIGDYTVVADANTDFKLQLGAATTGGYVQVVGRLQSDGTVLADKILVKKFEPGNGPKTTKPSGEPDHEQKPQKKTPEAVETPPPKGHPQGPGQGPGQAHGKGQGKK